MKWKLVRTLLNGKVTKDSIFLGLLSAALLIVIFLVQGPKLMANGDLVFHHGEYWRAWSSAFVHGDYKHLAHNTVAFTLLSILLHNYFGNFLYPFLSVLMAGLINLIVLAFYPPQVYLIGISGVVYFMAALWLTLYLCVERTRPLKSRLIIATGLALIFLAPEVALKEEVSYLAHAVGFLLGIPSALLFHRFYREEIHHYDQWMMKLPDPVFEEELENQDQEKLETKNETTLWTHQHQTHCSCK